MTPFASRVARYARDERLFRGARQLLVAVSGGPDSLAALLALLELREPFGFEVSAIHFDHQLRPDSRDDLEFVRAFCAEREVPCLTGEGDVRQVAKEQHASIEDTARKMRYQFLSFVAAEKRIDVLVTGHTADDQAETVLMRVLRGTGVRGLRGMLPLGAIPGGSAQRLARPLLCMTRAETVAYCQAAGVTPLIDSSNADPAYTRNRLRNSVLPALEAENPSLRASLLGIAASAREVFDGVEKASFAAQPIERTALGSMFRTADLRAQQNEALTLIIEREAALAKAEPLIDRTRLENLRRVLVSGTGAVSLGQIVVEASCGRVRVGPHLSVQPFEGKVLNVPGATVAGVWRIDVRTAAFEGASGAVDTSTQRGALRARPVQPGDRIHYRGMERKLSDAFALARVPRWERPLAIAIADSRRAHLVVTPATVLGASAEGEELLYVRAAPLPA